MQHIKNHRNLIQFLQISPLTFVANLGDKSKECLASVKFENYNMNNSCLKIENLVVRNCTGWKEMRISIKDNCIVLIDPNKDKIKYVISMDTTFKVNTRIFRVKSHSKIY